MTVCFSSSYYKESIGEIETKEKSTFKKLMDNDRKIVVRVPAPPEIQTGTIHLEGENNEAIP